MAEPKLDIDFVRSQFPAFAATEHSSAAFFENAGGSFACGQTISALSSYYVNTKVQPYSPFSSSALAGEQMDDSRRRWAEALGVETDEVLFGPSTSMNTYVIAQAVAATLSAGDQVIVTNQDHEANSGAMRRAVQTVGAQLVEWQIDPETGLLNPNELSELLNENTKWVCFPHCSNIIGVENDVHSLVELAHNHGARTIVDGVSYAPHGLKNIRELGTDIYLFSLYKVYSVHQGLIVAQNGVLDVLPHQGHWFNGAYPSKHLTPAGPDHAQEAAAGAVLNYIEASAKHHGFSTENLREAVEKTTELWQSHEDGTIAQVAEVISNNPAIHAIGPLQNPNGLHRCPTVAFVVPGRASQAVAGELIAKGIQCGSGNFYAKRLLDAIRVNGEPIDSDDGVVRVSWVHYTNQEDIDLLCKALSEITAE